MTIPQISYTYGQIRNKINATSLAYNYIAWEAEKYYKYHKSINVSNISRAILTIPQFSYIYGQIHNKINATNLVSPRAKRGG